MNTPTKSELLERHWLEFLRWVEERNKEVDNFNGLPDTQAIKPWYPTSDERGFWRWYIDNKLKSEEKS